MRPGPERSGLFVDRSTKGTGTPRSVRDTAIDVVFAVALGALSAYGLVVLLTR